MTNIEMKKCEGSEYACGLFKELNEFYSNTNGKLIGICKPCRRKQVQDRSHKIANNPKIIVDQKTCYDCGKTKSANQFDNNKYRLDGLTDECAECCNNRAKNNKRKYSSGEKQHKQVDGKYCWSCDSDKPIDQFNANNSMPDGHGSECRECINEYSRQYKDANPEYFQAYMKEYCANNQDKFREYGAKRRMAISAVVEHFSTQAVIDLYGDCCFYCEDGKFEHLDHYIPIYEDGQHTLENVRPACQKCNLSKSKKMPDEWYKYRAKKKEKGVTQ
jgi:hypothetical protein